MGGVNRCTGLVSGSDDGRDERCQQVPVPPTTRAAHAPVANVIGISSAPLAGPTSRRPQQCHRHRRLPMARRRGRRILLHIKDPTPWADLAVNAHARLVKLDALTCPRRCAHRADPHHGRAIHPGVETNSDVKQARRLLASRSSQPWVCEDCGGRVISAGHGPAGDGLCRAVRQAR